MTDEAAAREALAIALDQVGIVESDHQEQYRLDYATTDRLTAELGKRGYVLAALPAHPPAPPSEVMLRPVYPGDPGHGEPVWIEAAPPAPLPLNTRRVTCPHCGRQVPGPMAAPRGEGEWQDIRLATPEPTEQ